MLGSTQRLAAWTKWLQHRDGVPAAFACKQSRRLGDEPVQSLSVIKTLDETKYVDWAPQRRSLSSTVGVPKSRPTVVRARK